MPHRRPNLSEFHEPPDVPTGFLSGGAQRLCHRHVALIVLAEEVEQLKGSQLVLALELHVSWACLIFSREDCPTSLTPVSACYCLLTGSSQFFCCRAHSRHPGPTLSCDCTDSSNSTFTSVAPCTGHPHAATVKSGPATKSPL